MNTTRVSKAYRGSTHIGWKKTIGGREWFLGYGITPADEAKAIALAQAAEAKWMLSKLGGASQLSDADFEDAKDLAAGRPTRTSAKQTPALAKADARVLPSPQAPAPLIHVVAEAPPSAVPAPAAGQRRRWLYESIDEFVATTKLSLKPDDSNSDHVFNTCERILRARDAIQDVPLDQIRRKELDDWLLGIRALPSKFDGKPLGSVTIRNIVSGVRAALIKFAEWEWWTPPALWERAFKGYSIKKLQTPAERKLRKKRPPAHSVTEKRVLWHMSLPFTRAMMGLADWAGHTQKEISTLTFDEIKEEGGDMYIDRDRNKTGVPGRWWIPPEVAAVIRRIARTQYRGLQILGGVNHVPRVG